MVIAERYQRFAQRRRRCGTDERIARGVPNAVYDLPDHGQGRGRRRYGYHTSNCARAPPPKPEPPKVTFGDKFKDSNIRDALFDYDQSNLRADAEAILRSNASGLKDIFSTFAEGRVVVEGHCDDRGTNEYNLALGDRRATAAKDFLVTIGVSADRMTTISYGEERQVCPSADENCWQRNRRAHFSAR